MAHMALHLGVSTADFVQQKYQNPYLTCSKPVATLTVRHLEPSSGTDFLRRQELILFCSQTTSLGQPPQQIIRPTVSYCSQVSRQGKRAYPPRDRYI